MSSAPRWSGGSPGILGAGLDSSAYRHPDLAASVQVFEIDHPVTQSWKQQRLFELGVQQPSNLIFLPLDLSDQSLLDGFSAGGYTAQRPAFLSWLDVTQYLAEDAVFRILQQVAFLAPGTEIVFPYVVPRHTLDSENQRLFTIFTQSVSARGESWVTFLKPPGSLAGFRNYVSVRSRTSGPRKRTLVTLPVVPTRSAFPAWNT